jgi:hemolysin activation/secretion protein
LAGLMLGIFAMGAGGELMAQKRDGELGVLPPPPDLRQDEEKTFKERMLERRAAVAKKEAEERYQPKPEKPKESLEDLADAKLRANLAAQKVALPTSDPGAPGPEFMTSSGYRLKSFNDPTFWEKEGAPPVEQPLAVLPTMPDFRPDTEKSSMELRRERQEKMKQFEAAKAEAIAERNRQLALGSEVARQKALEAASRPPMPSTQYSLSDGPPVQPETPTGRGLKTFGANSRYVKDDQIVFDGSSMPAQDFTSERVMEEQALASLPAMPDFRPESEKSSLERYLEKKAKIKQVEEDARAMAVVEREQQRDLGSRAINQKEIDTASRPKVLASASSAYDGPPETRDGRSLRGIGPDSRYVKEDQVIFDGNSAPASNPERDIEEQALASLPAMPDFRTESEKSSLERYLEKKARIKEVEAARRQAIAERETQLALGSEVARQKALAAMNRPQMPTQSYAVTDGAPVQPATPTGRGLKAFGPDGRYVQNDQVVFNGQMATTGAFSNARTEEEMALAALPAMPDLRPDSEKTWIERYRQRQEKDKLAKEEEKLALDERKERQLLGAEMARQRELEAAIRPPSPEAAHSAYSGLETLSGNPLRAYNSNARFVQDGQVVSQGQEPVSGGLKWLNRGLNPDFSQVDDRKAAWSWRNPFMPDTAASGGTFEITPVGKPQGVLQGDLGGSAGADENQPLVSSLSGIRLVARTLEVTPSGISGVQGLVNDGVILPEKVAAVFEKYLGQPMSLASLNAMVKEAIVAYRKSDLPVVDVLIPEQEVTSGTLQLVVIAGRLDNVIVENNLYTSTRFLQDQIRLKRGEVLRESQLMEDLTWLNKNPFRRVDLIYSPGKDYGTTDIILRTEDVNPLSMYVGYEDSGTELLGTDRVVAGINWGGPLFFGPEDILSYQFSTGFDTDAELQGHTGVWTSYLPWRHYITLVGATVSSDARVVVDGEEIDTGGLNRQLGARYAVPLPSISTWTHELEFGFDIKSSNSDLFFNRLEVFDTTTEIAQFGIGYNVVQRDRNGMTRIDNEIAWSPGNLVDGNDDETFQTQRALASSEYVYVRTRLERTLNLPGQWTLLGRVEGQYSNANLLASETLGAGGYDTVRGFEQRVVRGDHGVVASVELRTPPVSFGQWAGFYNVRDAMVGLAFADFGYLGSADPIPDEPGHISLGSVGLGIRYQAGDNLTVRLDYGWQVDESGFDDGEDGRVHIGARATF